MDTLQPGPGAGPGHADRDWVTSHPAGSRPLPRRTVVAVVCVAAVVLVLAGVRSLSSDPDWPGGCGVEGRADWCSRVSGVMAGPALASVVRDYCPGLAGSAVSSVVPQPLDLADLGGHGARAQISGSRRSGTENALLGRPTSFAWVSRKVGGPGSGVVELRCVSRAGMTPALHLTGDQLRSTISAVGGGGGALSLARVAEFAVRSLPERSSVSFGFLRCDTHEVDLAAPKPGQRFVCNLQVYWRQGEGGYRLAFRVTPRNPYFTRIS